MPLTYDVVIVGARCAGATLATYLARAGVSVLVLDKSPLPSDAVLSTHTLHPSGMAVVDELGLGAAVRGHSPEMSSIRFDWNGGRLDVPFERGHGEYCPRRKRFDGLLQDAARQAGAELHDRTRVTSLLLRDGRVHGVEVEGAHGARHEVYARLVVGADGRNSRVAEQLGAESYLSYEAPRGMYWGYFPAPSGWGQSEQYPAGMVLHRSGATIAVAFHTDDDQLLIGALPLRRDLPMFRADPLASLRRTLRELPLFAPLVAPEPSEPLRGFIGDRYFFRRPVGPGWLLVGDAGHHKDFLSGDGMSEAMLRARAAAGTIIEALGAATQAQAAALYEHFWRSRDVEALPLFFHARDLADEHDAGVLDRAVFRHLSAHADDRVRFGGIFSRRVAPQDVLKPARVLRLCVARALRGEPSILREFLRTAKRSQAIERELRARRALLAAVDVAPRAQSRDAEHVTHVLERVASSPSAASPR